MAWGRSYFQRQSDIFKPRSSYKKLVLKTENQSFKIFFDIQTINARDENALILLPHFCEICKLTLNFLRA